MTDDRYWPVDTPMPDSYYQNRIPCPRCRRWKNDDGLQAVRLRTTDDGIARLVCVCCGHVFKLAICEN